MLSKTKVFIFFSISYLVWIFINNVLLNVINSFIVLLFIVVLFLLFYIFKKKYLSIMIFSIIWFVFGVFLSNYMLIKMQKNMVFVENFKNKVDIVVSIMSTKQINNDYKVYLWKVEKIQGKKVDEFIVSEVFTRWNYKLIKWDVIKFKSKIYTYKNSSNFKYKNYMLSNNIYFKTYPYSFEKISDSKINIIEKNTIKLRENLLKIIKKIYPKEEAIFLWWILLWAREELPKGLKTNFNNSWLTHFIAVSWFNITILIVFFSVFIKGFPTYIRLVTIVLAISFFAYLVWINPPVLRASIMWIIWYFIISFWRNSYNLSVILLTAAIMVSISPLSINYDVSFHLSFLAVLWIIYTEEWFEKVFYFVPKTMEIRTALSITFAALSFTLPVMIFNFWQVSILAPIANVLVTWTIPIAMLLGFISILAYSLFDWLWIFIWFFTWLLLKWDIWVVNTFWSSKFAVFKVDFWVYSWYYEMIYFIILVFIILWFRR